MEGQDLSATSKIWEDLAVTEMQLQLMSRLMKIKVGLADIEEFNLGLKGNLRNPQNEKLTEMQDRKIVKASREVKMRDEQIVKKKLMKSREQARTRVAKILGKNSKRYRTTIRAFRDAALARKAEYREKYDQKFDHLKFKYREDEADKIDKIPEEMQEFISLSIFDREKFDMIEIQSYETTCLGDLDLSNSERSVLRLHPKCSIIDTLHEGALEFEQELAYAKVRIQMHKELGEKLEGEEEVEMTPEEQEMLEEIEAKSRLTFDPVDKIFDDRKRRVTDLKECSRVTLPKPLPTQHETFIENI